MDNTDRRLVQPTCQRSRGCPAFPKEGFHKIWSPSPISETNNEAKYEAILTGHDLAKAVGVLLVVIHSDSQVIVNDYEAKGEWIKEYLRMIKERVSQKFLAKFVQILREENEQTDRLAKATFTERMDIKGQVLCSVQCLPAINKIDVQVIPMGVMSRKYIQ